MDYTIRALTGEDGAIVWEMLRYASHEPSLESIQEQPYLARYASGWGRAGDSGCVATRGAVSVAAAWLRLWSEDNKGFGYISKEILELAMAVAPDCRNQGIGTRLLMQLLDRATDRFPAVSLNVRQDNRVVRLYERAGFIKVPASEVINRTGGVSFNMVRKFE
ncbi:MAG: GNAT family N-acetyltransferase [Stenomitos rutilans HA7619-LM2]|nr:GNAT family N-acetyltransferase [Stenomitos rutilans HA7619-LM2]